jgi:hypothetical protein
MLYKKIYVYFAVFAIIFAFLPLQSLFAAMSGGTYELFADTFSSSEESLTSGGTYTLRGTMGEVGIQDISGGTYTLRSGFQAMEKGVLSLSFSTTSIELGTLSLTELASTTVSSTISSNAPTGYSLTFDEDGNLRDGALEIDDVADGEVTIGSEEYGVETIGGGGVLATDTAIDDGLVVASSLSEVVDEETGIVFKAAIAGTSRAGTYAQTITATLSVNP